MIIYHIFSYYLNFPMHTTCAKIKIAEIILYEGFRESKNTQYTVHLFYLNSNSMINDSAIAFVQKSKMYLVQIPTRS